MKQFTFLLLATALQLGARAQIQTPTSPQIQTLANIATSTPPADALAPLLYLASDQLKGRFIGRSEIDTAALYIANQFREAGAKTVPGATGYFQTFSREFVTPAVTKTVRIGSLSFAAKDVIQIVPGDLLVDAPVVDIGKESKESLGALDLKGKLVLLHAGSGTSGSARQDFRRAADIQKILPSKGALGLLVLLNADAEYWGAMHARFNDEQPADTSAPAIVPMVVLRRPVGLPADWDKSSPDHASIKIKGTVSRQLLLRNVLAFVPGTDPLLRDQFIVLSSHYDHLGVDPHPQMEEGKLDSIYNGARDNATGTAAVIDAARYFTRFPPRRSVLFIAFTAEEEGLLGSQYYAAHPLIPIKQTVYNLNIDNASYDDTTLISLVGLHRTSEDSLIITACKAYGLSVNGDPTGGSLFYESDNTPLAQKGVPAPTYSLGMRAFDSTITNRYHRLSDEVGNMDLHYVLKFIRAYILAAQYIADDTAQPCWTKGDEFEKAWLDLHPALTAP